MKKIWIIIFAGTAFFSGCTKDKLDVYEAGNNSVYFGVLNVDKSLPNRYVDTTRFSFEDLIVEDTVLGITVNVLGDYLPDARPFAYEVVAERSTAIPADQYVLLQEEGVIPGNMTKSVILVKLLRDKRLETGNVYLTLRLKANDYFGLDVKKEFVDNKNDKTINLLEHVLVFSDMVVKPKYWNRCQNLFLDYSADKYKLINRLCNMKAADWTPTPPAPSLTPDDYAFMHLRVKNHLQEQIDKKDPVYEINEQGERQLMKVKDLKFD